MRRALLLFALLCCGKHAQTIAMHAQNNSGQDGTATFVELADGKIDVTEVLKASTFPGPQSSHVHSGHCDDLREVAFPIYQVVTDGGTNDPFGTDGGTVTFHAVIAPMGGWNAIFDGDHAINAHDPRDMSLYVSCGDLQ
jgi:hypothetical protein